MSKATFRASGTAQGLTENMQILTGQRGDRLDKALTLREAADLGLIGLRRNTSGTVIPVTPDNDVSDPSWKDVQNPHAPVNVTADGAFHTIVLTWDAPTYRGHSFAEVLRAEVDNPAVAVRVGTTLANVYSDAVGKGFTAYYWVRFVNKNGMVGPINATKGLRAETSRDIQDIIDELDGKIKESHFDAWLKQDYQGVKQDVSSLESGVGSMWATKASAGDIKAGIGLVAKSDGTSQVFLAASQIFAYDPNNPTNTAPVFATDAGKLIIQTALIRDATIQIIHAEKITADSIKAGVSISAPLISGGSFDMGNAYMKDGAGGFGLGGPYSAWTKGWYTLITADGYIYTNRLRAEGGYVKNMTMSNCTIEEDCVVKGTVYAEKIVGGVFERRATTISIPKNTQFSGGSYRDFVIGSFPALSRSRGVTCVIYNGIFLAPNIGGGDVTFRLIAGGNIIASFTYSYTGGVSGGVEFPPFQQIVGNMPSSGGDVLLRVSSTSNMYAAIEHSILAIADVYIL